MKKYGRTLSEFTRLFRKERGLTQFDLAKLLGVHKQYPSNVERGTHKDPVTFATRLLSLRDLNASERIVLEHLREQALARSIKTRERHLRSRRRIS